MAASPRNSRSPHLFLHCEWRPADYVRSVTDPKNCRSMEEVRAGVDGLDAAIVELLSKRFRFMEAASRIKTERYQVRDEERKRAVIAHARDLAHRFGAPVEAIEKIYEVLVEASIAHELERFDNR